MLAKEWYSQDLRALLVPAIGVEGDTLEMFSTRNAEPLTLW